MTMPCTKMLLNACYMATPQNYMFILRVIEVLNTHVSRSSECHDIPGCAIKISNNRQVCKKKSSFSFFPSAQAAPFAAGNYSHQPKLGQTNR